MNGGDMSDTTKPSKADDALDFKQEANVKRFVRANRWVSLDIGGIPVR